MVLGWSGFGKADNSKAVKRTVVEFCARFGAEFASGDLRADTTHLVAKSSEQNGCMVAERTFKYCWALGSGVWVIRWEWLRTCLSLGALVSAQSFEVGGDSSCAGSELGGPERARKSAGTRLLLEGYNLVLQTGPGQPSETQLASLAKLSGAYVVNRVEELRLIASRGVRSQCLILARSIAAVTAEFPDVGISVVSYDWLLACICQHQVLPLSDYLNETTNRL